MAKLSNKGERFDLEISQGADFGPYKATMLNPPVAPALTGLPVDLTGCSFRAQIRKAYNSPTITVTIPITLSLTPTDGIYYFGLDAITTAAIPCGADESDAKSKYVWDMEMIDSLGRVKKVYYGDVVIFREITRD